MTTVLETTGLRKQYQMGEVTVDALRGVDFVVPQGQFVAVMGPSGAGKSTLLDLMGGLDTPSDGDVMLDGRHLALLSDDEVTIIRRRQVGFIWPGERPRWTWWRRRAAAANGLHCSRP